MNIFLQSLVELYTGSNGLSSFDPCHCWKRVGDVDLHVRYAIMLLLTDQVKSLALSIQFLSNVSMTNHKIEIPILISLAFSSGKSAL